MKDENQNVISQSNVNNAITFTGRRYDKESNLYYYRNRMYSPELGRFISKDPKGYVDGMNLYSYVKNNPLKYVDAYGTIATNINNFSGTVFENWQDNYNRSFVDDFVNQSGDILSSTVDAVVNIPDILWGAGDYLAEVSGFKDYQNPSVVLGNHIQDEAIANTQEALTSFYNSYFTLEGLSQTYNDLTTYMDEEPGAFTADIFFMALPVPSKSLKVVDDIISPTAGQTVYRVYGGDSIANGASWTPINPAMINDFRKEAGLPSGGSSGYNNSARFILEGILEDPSKVVKTRSALPLDGNAGGLDEYIIPNALKNGAVKLKSVRGINPEL